MAKRPPHTLPYVTHQQVGELLFQARNTLVHTSVIMGNSCLLHPAMARCTSIVTRLDRLRSQLDDALFAEHGGPRGSNQALLRVYYPHAPLWIEHGPYDPSKGYHRRYYRRKWLLTWQDHLTLAEWLWQSWDMTAVAWHLLLSAYGATDPKNRLLETLVPSGTAYSQIQLWCQDRLHDAERVGGLQWPPDLERDLYTNGAKYFQPWATRCAPALVETPA
jgi:hypothetical protein